MIPLHKTFGITTLCLLILMMVGWASTAFSQQSEKIIKKKIIIKTIDENGEEQTQIIESEEDEIDLPEGLFEGESHRPFFFHKDGNFAHPFAKDRNLEKKVIVLSEGEGIPEDLKAEIQEMGVDLIELEQKLATAEKSVRIYKEGGQAAKIEVDSDVAMVPMPDRLGTMNRMKMFKLDNDEPLNFNFDFDIEEEDGEGHGMLKLNRDGEIQTFDFEGTEIPEDIKEQLEEMGIFLDGKDGLGKMKMFKFDDEDFDFDKLKEGKSMIWIDDEGNSFNLDDCNFKGADKNACTKIAKANCCDGCSPGNCCDKCKTACSSNAQKFSCKKEAKPRLGVFLSEDDTNGAMVKGVSENSGAAKGGLQKGDVIVGINKNKITSNEALIDIINKHQVGDAVTVKYKRDGKVKKTQVTLQAAPARRHHKMNNWNGNRHHGFMPMHPRHFQVDCEKACKTPMLGVMIDEEVERGVHINATFDGSGAVKAGLAEGDVILSIAGVAVNTTDEVVAKIQQYKPGEEVEIAYLRNGKETQSTVILTSQAISPYKADCDCGSPNFRKEEVKSKEIIIIKAGVMSENEGASIFEVEEMPKKVNRLAVNDFSLFPNPNQGDFIVSFELDNKESLTVTVVDVVGKEVYREVVKDFTGSYRKTIDVSKYAKGTYFLNVIQGDQVFTQQFVYGKE